MGAAILGVGIWLKVEKGGYEDISSYDYATPSNIAIVIGVVMLFVAFLGCFGSIKELRHMLLAVSQSSLFSLSKYQAYLYISRHFKVI